MNFFGHAAVASWHPGATAAFVVGAMLPDVIAISGARSARPATGDAGRGVALHHATDEVFHAAPDFVALTGLARAGLDRGGLPRGSAWGAAHVGVELLIDGTLVADARAGDLYLRALRDAEAHIACAGPTDAGRVARFLDRARAAGIPYSYGDPRAVAGRVERALLSRPRLALAPGHTEVLADVLGDLVAQVRARADALLDHVRRRVTPRS
jgi:hypothetical protein